MDISTFLSGSPQIDLERGSYPIENLASPEISSINEKEDPCQVQGSSFKSERRPEDESVPSFRRLCRKIAALVVPRKVASPYDEFDLVVREIEGCNVGYPYLASFLDSSEDFMIYRRFGFLHTRLLLQKQDELVELEKQLDTLDQLDKRNDRRALIERNHDEKRTSIPGVQKTRTQLLTEIEETLLKYDTLITNAQHMVALNRPPNRDWKSVAWFIMNKTPLVDAESNFIWHKEDLVTLRPGREHAWLDTVVRKIICALPRRLMEHIFCQKGTKAKTTDKLLFMPRRSSLKHLVNTLVVFWVLILFTVPVYTLYFIGQEFDEKNPKKSQIVSMVILFVATGVFAIGLALFTKAKRHETLAASAAYCALLVVFIANLGMDADKKEKLPAASG